MALRKRQRQRSRASTPTHIQSQIETETETPTPRSIATFGPLLLGLLDLFLAYFATLRIQILDLSMGLTSWWSARSEEEDENGEERLAMIERSPRRAVVDEKQVKRRRHKPNGHGDGGEFCHLRSTYW